MSKFPVRFEDTLRLVNYKKKRKKGKTISENKQVLIEILSSTR